MAQDVTPAGRTGDAVHVRELVWNLAELGHKVILLGRDVQGVSDAEYDEYQKVLESFTKHPNIRLYLIRTSYKLSFPLIKNYFVICAALKILSNKRMDIIYSRSFNCLFEVMLCKLFGIPLVLESNENADAEKKLLLVRRPTFLEKNLSVRIKKALLKVPIKLVVVTETIKFFLHKSYSVPLDKIVVIPNGANTERFKPMDKNIIRTKLGFKQNDRIVCFAGNLAPWQGLEYLIKASIIILQKNPDINFLIVGDGERKKNLEQLVNEHQLQNNYIFTGQVPYEIVPEYINASDICVSPFTLSSSGGSKLKIYEYLSCGKAVVASNIQGITEVINGIDGGYLVEPENPAQLAEAIIILLNDESLKKSISEKGHNYIIENYSWRITSEKVAGVCADADQEYNRT
jgi:glycosyltransferase involved in cell wall biosynthesis